METKIPAREVTATKVFVIENAAEGASASPAGPFVPGAGGEEVFGVGDEGEGDGEEVVVGEGVGDVFVEGDGAGAELGDNDRVGAGAGACCAMHEVANNPNIRNTLIATEPMLLYVLLIEKNV
ncbi:uncharacterized protein LOC127074948 isoform X2 [Lathyrus oleraceus]|uniref:uncharacterized protein LOC127074948 isoform X2 n=1 Tax=Pisum sativum TaxID=3888 RepID=UPI0021D38FB6|nr:uncharacterized protein LOC127074948 isoform X2 [Pisum sativum]